MRHVFRYRNLQQFAGLPDQHALRTPHLDRRKHAPRRNAGPRHHGKPGQFRPDLGQGPRPFALSPRPMAIRPRRHRHPHPGTRFRECEIPDRFGIPGVRRPSGAQRRRAGPDHRRSRETRPLRADALHGSHSGKRRSHRRSRRRTLPRLQFRRDFHVPPERRPPLFHPVRSGGGPGEAGPGARGRTPRRRLEICRRHQRQFLHRL